MNKKYYKAFDRNLCCRGFRYEVGKTYKINEYPILCRRGFHFCDSIAKVYEFYDKTDNTRVCEVEPLGNIVVDKYGIKFATNEIKIIKEIKSPREFTNISKSSSGYCNSGNHNSGNYNSGYGNSGSYNSGDCNSGYNNSGDCNSGNYNSGNYNSGNLNLGYKNSGNHNSGSYNSGDWNIGYRNSGIFNTNEAPKIKMFNKESNWTYYDWQWSRAHYIMNDCPCSYSKFISEEEMTKEEKESHLKYKTIGGYVKNIVVADRYRQRWWDNLDENDKMEVLSLPNFDSKIFKECTGIDVEKKGE